MFYFLCALISYLVGSFPTGVFLTKRKYGLDVRDMGSGNIGATNVTRVFGWYAGVVVFIIDFLKAAIPLTLISRLYPDAPWAVVICGIFLVLGHCYSLYLGFNGGKGVATSLGCLIVAMPWGALISGAAYVLTLVLTKISAVGSLAGILAAFIYLVTSNPSAPLVVLVTTISAIVLWRHKENIQRLKETIRAKRLKKEGRA